MNEDEDHRTEEELDAEAEEAVSEFFQMIQVWPELNDRKCLDFKVIVPVVESIMDVTKLGVPKGAPVPSAVQLTLSTEMPMSVWESAAQFQILEGIKREAVTRLDEKGVLVAE